MPETDWIAPYSTSCTTTSTDRTNEHCPTGDSMFKHQLELQNMDTTCFVPTEENIEI